MPKSLLEIRRETRKAQRQVIRQAFFNKTAEHLFEQGVQSRLVMLEGTCAYKGPNNTSCAIGCHIPDEKYKIGMEGNGVRQLLHSFKKELRGVFTHIPLSLMDDLQTVHDCEGYGTVLRGFNTNPWSSTGAMRHALRMVAAKHNLDYLFLHTLSFPGKLFDIPENQD